MKNLGPLAAGVALALSLSACNRGEPATDGNVATTEASVTDAAAVKQAFADFNAAIAAKDLAKVKAQYASDAVMVIPDQPPYKGIDAIMGDYETFFADPAGKYVPGTESTEVSSGGDLAYGQVNYQTSSTNPTTKAVGTVSRYNIVVYKKQADGSWKVIQDVNAPLPKAS